MKTKILLTFIVFLIGFNFTTIANHFANSTFTTTDNINLKENAIGCEFWNSESMSMMEVTATDTTCETALEIIPGNICNPTTYTFIGTKKFFKFTATTTYINIVVSNVGTSGSEINNLLLTSLPCYPQQPIIAQTNNPLQLTVNNLIIGNTYVLRLRKLSTYATYFSICFKNIASTTVIANAGNDASICQGNNIQLNATGGTNYLWSPPTGLSNPNISNPVASPLATTTYTVTVSNNGIFATDNVVITVNPLPIANAGSDVTINSGENVQIGSDPVQGYSYIWNPPTGLSNTTIANPYASPTLFTTYNLLVKNTLTGCQNNDLVSVNVIANEPAQPGTSCENAIEITPDNFCSPDTFSFSGNYMWFKFTANTSYIDIKVSDIDIAGSGINALFIGNYNCTSPIPFAQATNPLQLSLNVTENNIYLVAVYKQSTNLTPSNFSICFNNFANIQVVADAGSDVSICGGSNTQLNASGGASYSWSPSTGLSNPNISNPFASPLVTTTYTVTVSAFNSSTTDEVVVTVKPLPLVDAGNNINIYAGDSVQLGNYPSSPSFSYLWTPKPFVNNYTLAHPFAKPNLSTTFYLSVTDMMTGCYNTDSVKVNVMQPPGSVCESAIEITPDNFCTPDTFIFAGIRKFFKFTASSAFVNIIVSNVDISGSGITNMVLTSLPCFPQQPIIAQTSNPLQLTLNNLIIGKTYILVLKKDIAATSQFSIGLKDTPINAFAGNDISVCYGSSAQLNASGGINYIWSPAADLSNENISNPTVAPFLTTTYTVTVSDFCSSATDDVVVTVEKPIANAGNDQTVCAETNVTLVAKGGASFQWDNGISNGLPFVPTITTAYTVTVTDDNGCTATDDVLITVNPLPIVEAGFNQTICAGGSVTLNATGGSTLFQWDSNIINGVPFIPSTTSTYNVTGTDINGCSAIDNVVITVNQLPFVEAGIDQAVCAGGSVTLNATGGTLYQWNNNIINGVAFIPLTTTSYSVSATDDNGCTATDEVIITVNQLPLVEAGIDQAVCAGGSVTLNATGGTLYQWDNNIINGVAIIPLTTTTYSVTATDDNGCSAIDNVVITVNPILVADAGNDQVVCVGGSVTLYATGGTLYQWDNGISNGVPFTPLTSTTFTVTVTDENGCYATGDVIVTVNPEISITLSSLAGTNNQNLCMNTPLTDITYTATGATSVDFFGLPAGVVGNWESNIIIINGMPTNTGTFNYVISIKGLCDTISNTGTIIVTPNATITLTSAVGSDVQNVTINSEITHIKYNITDAIYVTITGLPPGVTGTWNTNSNKVIIKGKPIVTGTFNYTLTVVSSCGILTATGIIISSNKIGKKEMIYSQDGPEQEFPTKVYPNPAKDKLNIKVSLPIGKTGSVYIFDANGNEVMTLPLTEGDNSLKVNLSNVASGLYYYKVYVDKQMVKSEKLIIIK